MRFKVVDKLRIFDFDDTLVWTDAKIRIKNKGLALSTFEFGRYKKEKGDEFDYKDFRTGELKNPVPTAFFRTGFKKIVAGGADIMILTARPQENTREIEAFLAPYVAPERLIIVGGAQTPDLKKQEIERLLGRYKDIRFYDDSVLNVAAVNSLKEKAKKLGTILVARIVKK